MTPTTMPTVVDVDDTAIDDNSVGLVDIVVVVFVSNDEFVVVDRSVIATVIDVVLVDVVVGVVDVTIDSDS